MISNSRMLTQTTYNYMPLVDHKKEPVRQKIVPLSSMYFEIFVLKKIEQIG